MPAINNLYPHLLPPDIPVWLRFLAAYGHQFQRIEYDVRVGKGRPASHLLPDNIKQMALDLSMRRIDAVGFTAAGIICIEITKLAGLRAIGQLTTYPILYRQTFDPKQTVTALLVAEALDSDIEPILIEKNLDYVLLQEET